MLKSPQLLQVDIELSDKPKNTIQDYFTILDEFITARECAELNTFQGYSNKRTSDISKTVLHLPVPQGSVKV